MFGAGAVVAFNSTSMASQGLPDVCPVSKLPYIDKKTTRFSKHEEMRLACCMLSKHQACRGVTFLEFLHGARERQDLDRSDAEVVETLGRIFNNPHNRWPQFEAYEVVRRFNPHCDPDSPHLHLPRRPSDLIAHWRKDVKEQLNAFSRAFHQSGKGRIDDWDFTLHPIADFLFHVDVQLLEMCTGAFVAPYAGHVQQEDVASGDDATAETGEITSSVRSSSSARRKRRRVEEPAVVPDPILTALQEASLQQRELVATLGQLVGMFKDFLHR